jgi:hypothetical protein
MSAEYVIAEIRPDLFHVPEGNFIYFLFIEEKFAVVFAGKGADEF